MDKEFNGLIHTKVQTLTSMPSYKSNQYTKDEIDAMMKYLLTKINAIDFLEEEELDEAIDIVEAGGAPIDEKGE